MIAGLGPEKIRAHSLLDVYCLPMFTPWSRHDNFPNSRGQGDADNFSESVCNMLGGACPDGKQTFPTSEQGFLVGRGCGQLRSCYALRVRQTSRFWTDVVTFVRVEFAPFAVRSWLRVLEDMTGSTFEVCLCLSLVLLGRFEVPFPQCALEGFFTATSRVGLNARGCENTQRGCARHLSASSIVQ